MNFKRQVPITKYRINSGKDSAENIKVFIHVQLKVATSTCTSFLHSLLVVIQSIFINFFDYHNIKTCQLQ